MLRKLTLLSLILLAFQTLGCGKTPEREDYSSYSGLWTTGGYSADYTRAQGGASLSVEIEQTKMTGSYYYNTSSYNREAGVDEISCEIKAGQAEYSFADDGWGSSGVLRFAFNGDEITVTVEDLKLSDSNPIGMSVTGSTVRRQGSVSDPEILPDGGSSGENDLAAYREQCSFWPEVVGWHEQHERTGMDIVMEPMFETDKRKYEEEDFQDCPSLIIHLAKNEIYARHGYMFSDPDLDAYFRGQEWYNPETAADEFDASVFNEVEQENVELLAKLDHWES